MHVMQTFAEAKAVVQLVLPHGWIARINQLATERGVNRSALIRAAIAATYFAEQPSADSIGMAHVIERPIRHAGDSPDG
jgi:Ribbon-helix-helix protein, copG family